MLSDAIAGEIVFSLIAGVEVRRDPLIYIYYIWEEIPLIPSQMLYSFAFALG